jgi:hypothetical protein
MVRSNCNEVRLNDDVQPDSLWYPDKVEAICQPEYLRNIVELIEISGLEFSQDLSMTLSRCSGAQNPDCSEAVADFIWLVIGRHSTLTSGLRYSMNATP